MSDERRERSGVAFGIGAYLMWGLFPLYWPLLRPAGAVEMLAHRVVWSLAVVIGILALRRSLGQLSSLSARRAGLLTLAAILIALNWGVYIYGVTTGNVVETSLGYFINPLVTIGLGVLVLGERLRPAQRAAVAVAGVAVAVLTIDYGRPPWIALVLAFSFAGYGLLKKHVDVGTVESLGVETAALFLPALGYLLVLAARGTGTFTTEGPGHTLLLVSAGVVTAVPLLCFGAAAIRVPLTVIGLLQYLTPVMQFLLGVLVFREPMPASRVVGFALVWAALIMLTVDALSRRRRPSAQVPAESLT